MGGAEEGAFGQRPGHEAVRRGDDGADAALPQGIEGRQTVLLPAPAGDGPGPQLPLPAQEQHRLRPQEGPEVLPQSPGLALVRADEEGGAVQGLAEGRAHQRPVDALETRDLRRAAPAVDPGQKLPDLREGIESLQDLFHEWLLYAPGGASVLGGGKGGQAGAGLRPDGQLSAVFRDERQVGQGLIPPAQVQEAAGQVSVGRDLLIAVGGGGQPLGKGGQHVLGTALRQQAVDQAEGLQAPLPGPPSPAPGKLGDQLFQVLQEGPGLAPVPGGATNDDRRVGQGELPSHGHAGIAGQQRRQLPLRLLRPAKQAEGRGQGLAKLRVRAAGLPQLPAEGRQGLGVTGIPRAAVFLRQLLGEAEASGRSVIEAQRRPEGQEPAAEEESRPRVQKDGGQKPRQERQEAQGEDDGMAVQPADQRHGEPSFFQSFRCFVVPMAGVS